MHLAAVLDPRDEPLAALELVRPDPLWFALACALQEPSALGELEREHLSRVPAFIARVDRSPAFIDEVLQLYQLHRSTVARRLAEHRRRVLELTREELRARLKLTDSEFDSVLAILRSQLAISVRGALG